MLVLGVLLALGGAVWLAQGLNLPFAPASFMTADPAWIAIGALALVVGLAILVRDVRQRIGARHPPEDPD
jgi:hypothetical protein